MNKQENFPSYFTAWRDSIEAHLDPLFQSKRNVSVVNRLTALHAQFDSNMEPKMLGVIPIGGPPVHSHEHRLLFSVPHFDRAALDDWWRYAQEVQKTLVSPDPSHQFTLISIILICQSADASALARLRWRASEVSYHKPQAGWSSIRFSIIHMTSGKITSNRAGAPLADLLRAAMPTSL